MLPIQFSIPFLYNNLYHKNHKPSLRLLVFCRAEFIFPFFPRYPFCLNHNKESAKYYSTYKTTKTKKSPKIWILFNHYLVYQKWCRNIHQKMSKELHLFYFNVKNFVLWSNSWLILIAQFNERIEKKSFLASDTNSSFVSLQGEMSVPWVKKFSIISATKRSDFLQFLP